jgi:hypothetical protein
MIAIPYDVQQQHSAQRTSGEAADRLWTVLVLVLVPALVVVVVVVAWWLGCTQAGSTWPGLLCRAAISGGMMPRSSSCCCLACRLGNLRLEEACARTCTHQRLHLLSGRQTDIVLQVVLHVVLFILLACAMSIASGASAAKKACHKQNSMSVTAARTSNCKCRASHNLHIQSCACCHTWVCKHLLTLHRRHVCISFAGQHGDNILGPS